MTDIFKTGADALVNPVNCVGVMGKGLALEFKRGSTKQLPSDSQIVSYSIGHFYVTGGPNRYLHFDSNNFKLELDNFLHRC